MTNREAIKVIEWIKNTHPEQITCEALGMAISALEKQEQTCDTCKHGYFGDTWCERCAVRFASHYEPYTEEDNE